MATNVGDQPIPCRLETVNTAVSVGRDPRGYGERGKNDEPNREVGSGSISERNLQ
jgi:hypothetical protein